MYREFNKINETTKVLYEKIFASLIDILDKVPCKYDTDEYEKIDFDSVTNETERQIKIDAYFKTYIEWFIQTDNFLTSIKNSSNNTIGPYQKKLIVSIDRLLDMLHHDIYIKEFKEMYDDHINSAIRNAIYDTIRIMYFIECDWYEKKKEKVTYGRVQMVQSNKIYKLVK